ncbi:MAG TPA: thiamine-phosphate kinase [Acidimicrobiales bacterium]|nr:thiamine-phosphate kinase [Acidimicrobiales bacterium]
MDVTGGGEFAAIEQLRRLFPAIGDDCAVVDDGLLLAADAVVRGVHGDDVQDLGWKAVVANVSDVAAMGGTPRWLLVTVAGPPTVDVELLHRGVHQAATAFDCEVVGGDLTNAPELVVAVAVVGRCDGVPVLRSGAGAGDAVFVTGPVGGAAATGWRARPQARVAEGRAAREAGATAMIDVSDGLAADLGHVLDAGGVGVELTHVPVAEGASLEQALGGGEDYELVFTAPDVERVAETFAEAGLAVPERIGLCVADAAVRLLAGQPLPAVGWEHRFGQAGRIGP